MLVRSSIGYLIKSGMHVSAGRSSLTYCGTAILISIVAVQDCILTRKGVFPLLYILTSMWYHLRLILAILTSVGWNPRVALVCVFMMTKDIEHFF